jgi:lipopolysaccharide/colanic/teichoic acid biosynthesis glycosyltransferase
LFECHFQPNNSAIHYVFYSVLEKYEKHHRVRMAIKPGLTGMWQVSGRSSITDFEEVVALDLKYIREWSIGLDIRILLKTVKIVLTGSGSQ